MLIRKLLAPVLACVSLSLTAQEPGAERVLTLDAGPYSARALIDLSADFLGRTYLFAAEHVDAHPGSISVATRLRLGPAEAETVVGQMMFALGFVMLPVEPERDVWEWIWLQGPRRNEVLTRALPRSVEQVLRARRSKQPVACVVPVRRVDGRNLVQIVRIVLMAGTNNGVSTFAVGAHENAVVLCGLADQVANAIDTVREIDAAAVEAAAIRDKKLRLAVEERIERIEQSIERLQNSVNQLVTAGRR